MKQITILNDNMTYHLLIDDKSVWLNMAELVTLKNTIETAIQSGFKEGDFLLFEGECDLVTIFAAYTSDGSWHEHASISLGSMELQTGLHITAYDFEGYKVRQASDEEKKILLDALDEHGYAWNPETLEIEKKPAFEIGKLYVFDEQDEDGNITVIGNLIGKNEGKDTLTFGNQYEIETEKFVTNQTFDLNISLHKELREATENEVELFSKHYSMWQEKEKEAMAQPDFKPFDKVLVRCNKNCKWLPAFFIRDYGKDAAIRYSVLSIRSGVPADFASCIPFEGNEHLAFTNYDFEDLPF